VQDCDALVLPGGRGPKYLRTYPAVVTICHAAQLLAGAGLLEGRSCSAYRACRYEVERAGGTYADIAIDGAFTEGNLVSASAWPAHPAWRAQFLSLLRSKISP